MTLAVSAMPSFFELNMYRIFIMAFMIFQYLQQINIKYQFIIRQKYSMSIYSGFATRNQQQLYDEVVYELIAILSKRIIKGYEKQQTDELKFSRLIKEIFLKLNNLQKNKYLEPNMSTALYDILQYIIAIQKASSRALERKSSQNKINSIVNKINSNQNKIDRKNTSWVKLKSESQQQGSDFNQRNHQNYPNQKTHQDAQIQTLSKYSHLNPQIKQLRKVRQQKVNFQNTLRNIDSRKAKNISMLRQVRTKHNSLRQFDGEAAINTFNSNRNQMNITSTNKKQIRNDTFKDKNPCPHCTCEKSNSKSARNCGFAMPQLVKQYIQQTNHNYMKHFRKRKLKFAFQQL